MMVDVVKKRSRGRRRRVELLLERLVRLRQSRRGIDCPTLDLGACLLSIVVDASVRKNEKGGCVFRHRMGKGNIN